MSYLRTLALCLTATLLLAGTTRCAGQTDDRQPKYEVRAVWLTTFMGLDWPNTTAATASEAQAQHQELTAILDKLKAANINTVLLQTRIRATTIYPSTYEPWDECLTGTSGMSPGYDPLAFATDECHKRGMELHAWVVAIPAGKWNAPGCKRLRTRHPSMICRIGDYGYIDPECDEAAGYIAGICREITENYDVDGIHLDYIRYPENWKRSMQGNAGRRNITRIVRNVYSTVKSIKPWVKVSCAPIGKHSDLARYSSHGWNAYHRVMQDAQYWMAEGIVDMLFPMAYFKGNQFFPFALDWQENSHGRTTCIGLGIYNLSKKERDWNIDVIEREMFTLRGHGMGHAFFRSKFLTDNTKGIYDFTRDVFNTAPALVPPMTWLSEAVPTAPRQISVTRLDGLDILSWDEGADNSDGPYLTYNIYASKQFPVDTSDGSNLILSGHRGLSVSVPHNTGSELWNYAVTAVDRYGNESRPTGSGSAEKCGNVPSQLLTNDGTRLDVPAKGNTTDADCLIIETLQGAIVAMRPYDGGSTDISSVANGFYVLKSLDARGTAHRIGMFFIGR